MKTAMTYFESDDTITREADAREYEEANACGGWGCVDMCADCAPAACILCPEWERIADNALTVNQQLREQLDQAHQHIGALLSAQGSTMTVKAAARAFLTREAK